MTVAVRLKLQQLFLFVPYIFYPKFEGSLNFLSLYVCKHSPSLLNRYTHFYQDPGLSFLVIFC